MKNILSYEFFVNEQKGATASTDQVRAGISKKGPSVTPTDPNQKAEASTDEVRAEQQIEQKEGTAHPLGKEFWTLVHNRDSDYRSFCVLLNKQKRKDGTMYSAGSNITKYLVKICKNPSSFEEFKNIPMIDRLTAKTIAELEIAAARQQ